LHLQGGQGRGQQRQGQQRQRLQQHPDDPPSDPPRLQSVFSPQQTPLPKPLTMLQIPLVMSFRPLSQQGRQHSR